MLKDFPQLYQASNSKHLWVSEENSTIAAHAGFYPSVMKVENLHLPVAGIGGVFSDEAHKGKGYASELIKKCTEEAKKEGAALAFLWSDKHEFYAKQGFHLVGRQWTITLEPKHSHALRALGVKAGVPAEALQITDEAPAGELLRQSHVLMSIYPLGNVRSAEEHALYLESGSCRVVSAWVGKKLAAYFVIGKGKDLQGYIHEWAGAEGALHHLAAQCLEDFNQPLHLLSPQFMPNEVKWIYALEEAGFPFAAEYLALVKLLDFDKVKKLTHEYMKRIGLKPDELSLNKDGDLYRVAWRGGKELEVEEKEFLQLLFGPELPEDKELQAFLPMRLWYWGMDSV